MAGGGLAGMSLKGDAKKPELAKLLCENSGTDVEWLVDKFNLDLSLVARLGYHHRRSMHRMCLRRGDVACVGNMRYRSCTPVELDIRPNSLRSLI